MSLTRIYAIFIRQVFLFKGNPIRLISIFLWIIIDIILWGFITKYLSTFGSATFSFVNIVLGAIILWEFTSRIMHGVMTSFLEDVWTQNFINFFTSPLQIKEYVTGLVATSLATGLAGFLAMAMLAGLFFGYNVFKIGLLMLPFLLVLFIFGTAMGLFMTAIILRFGTSAEWLGWPIPFAMSIFAGVFYPIATLPAPLQALSKIIPASYVFESLRGLSGGVLPPNLLTNFLISLVLAMFYLIITYIFLIMVYRRNLKNGQISRFSAEA